MFSEDIHRHGEAEFEGQSAMHSAPARAEMAVIEETYDHTERCLENAPRTFESDILPKRDRFVLALANQLHDRARYPGKFGLLDRTQPTDRLPTRRVGFLNLHLPSVCNATCPNYCFTEAKDFRASPDDATQEELRELIDEFASLGGRCIRVLGRGEPFLYRSLPALLDHAHEKGVQTVLFTNGLLCPPAILERIQVQPGNHVYVKLWSENAARQNEMVVPRIQYTFEEGPFGLAPRGFYELWRATGSKEGDDNRIGIETMVSRENIEEIAQIARGPKRRLHWFIEPMQRFGQGAAHDDLAVTVGECRNRGIPVTLECNNPPRASYMATVDTSLRLCPEVFVHDGAIALRGRGLRDAWDTAIESETFFQARYKSTGCFCQEYAAAKRG